MFGGIAIFKHIWKKQNCENDKICFICLRRITRALLHGENSIEGQERDAFILFKQKALSNGGSDSIVHKMSN